MKKLINYFQPELERLDQENYFQIKNSRLFVQFIFIGMFIALFFMVNNTLWNKPIALKINAVGFFGYLLTLFLYKKTANFKNASVIFIATCLMILSLQHVFTPTMMAANLFWIPLLCVGSTYLFGPKSGKWATVTAILCGVTAEIVTTYFEFTRDPYSVNAVVRNNLIVFIGTSLIAHHIYSRMLKEKASIISQIEDQKDSLFELNKTRAVLLNIIVHDISNPLTIIKMSSQRNLQQPDPQLSEKSFKQISRATETIEEIVEGVKTMRSMEDGKLQLALGPVDLTETVQITIDQLANMANGKNVSIVFENETPCYVYAERVSLVNSVLVNLISNAIKFSPEKSRVRISIVESDGIVVLKVVDSGVGIPEEMLPHLFSTNHQTNRKGTNGEKGTGFGLPILKMFLDKYEAEISVLSSTHAANSGTVFKLKFKAASMEEQSNRDKSVA